MFINVCACVCLHKRFKNNPSELSKVSVWHCLPGILGSTGPSISELALAAFQERTGSHLLHKTYVRGWLRCLHCSGVGKRETVLHGRYLLSCLHFNGFFAYRNKPSLTLKKKKLSFSSLCHTCISGCKPREPSYGTDGQ